MRRIPELLAPAGSWEALVAAICGGADAVYLSGKRFGARKFASNFDEASLERAIEYAHLRGVSVYVTVNTLVREDELADLATYLVELYRMGADAILLQDPGAARLACEVVPELQRHASTQMTIHNAEGVAWAIHAGFGRVVLAREVGLDVIREMSPELRAGQGLVPGGKAGSVGLEVFVHGALCYSYSGQCLLSSAIGGRSGNRGMCAQPCRKEYVLLRGELDRFGRPTGLASQGLRERFLISTRDLCTYRHLDRIVRSQVASLKIEGRMKSPEYVAVVTDIYRRALDAIARGKWSPSQEDERDLALAFNRGFTEGHLLGASDVMGREASDNRGLLIGTVASFDSARGEAAVRLSSSLTPARGDGLVFQAPGQEVGLVVQRAVSKDGLLRLSVPERIKPGARVSLTGSVALGKKAEQIMKAPGPQIPLHLFITWQDERPTVRAVLEDGSSISVTAEARMEKAKSQPLTAQQIESQMRRTGGTPFSVKRVEMDYPGGLFFPTGALNQLRREILDKVSSEITGCRRPAPESVKLAASALERFSSLQHGRCPAPKGLQQTQNEARALQKRRGPTLSVCVDSIEALRGAVQSGCDRVYLEPDTVELRRASGIDGRMAVVERMLEEGLGICGPVPLVWKWPKIARSEFFRSAAPVARRAGIDGLMVENPGALQAAIDCHSPSCESRSSGKGLRLYGGMGLNVCNHLAVQALAPPLSLITLSPELSGRQMRSLLSALADGPELEILVEGSLEVMVSEDCIPALAKGADKTGRCLDDRSFWGLQDMRRIFPIRIDDENRTHIYNSAETCLVDLMPEIISMGLDGIAIDARGRGGDYAREMTAIYREAIDITVKGGDDSENALSALKERILPLALGGITRGHFVKGIRDEI